MKLVDECYSQEQESKMRMTLNEIYFGKTKKVRDIDWQECGRLNDYRNPCRWSRSSVRWRRHRISDRETSSRKRFVRPSPEEDPRTPKIPYPPPTLYRTPSRPTGPDCYPCIPSPSSIIDGSLYPFVTPFLLACAQFVILFRILIII